MSHLVHDLLLPAKARRPDFVETEPTDIDRDQTPSQVVGGQRPGPRQQRSPRA